MTENALGMKCAVCNHIFSVVPDEKMLEEMALYCPNCDVKITLESFNTTAGTYIAGYIPNDVINEHIAKTKDKDWKKKRGMK